MLLRIVSKTRIIFFLVASLLFSCTGVDKYVGSASDSLTELEKEQLCDGDIILRRGSGFVSGFIVSSFNEYYPVSHCGIICRDMDSIRIIHSIAGELTEVDGTQSCSIDEFVSHALPNSVIVTRFKSMDNSHISCSAKRYLEKGLKFDHKFDSMDSTKLFCSELVRDAIRDSHHIDLFGDNSRSNHGFRSFYDSAYFKVIISHQ